MQALSAFPKIPETAADGKPTLGAIGELLNLNFKKLVAVVSLASFITPGMTDAGPALMEAQQEAVRTRRALFIPYFPAGLDVATTAKWLPLPGEREFQMDVICCSDLNWKGSSNNTILFMAGMRGSKLVNLGYRIPNGITNVVCEDVDTINATATHPYGTNSTSHIIWEGGGALLGNGKNNKGTRLGHISGEGGDISNCRMNKRTYYGNDGGFVGQGGLQSLSAVVPSQIGIQNEGRNVLNMGYTNMLFAYLGKGYTSIRGSVDVPPEQYGGPNDGGNGAVGFSESVWSHVNLCMQFSAPQNYSIRDSRFEDCRAIYHHTDGADKPIVSFSNIIIDNCYTSIDNGSGYLFSMGRPGSLILENVYAACHGIVYGNNCVTVGSFSGQKGALFVRGGGFKAGESGFIHVNDNAYTPYLQGVARMFEDENGVTKTAALYPDSGGSQAAPGEDVSSYFDVFGNNVYLKNENGSFIIQSGGQDVLEGTSGRMYIKKPSNFQGGDVELEAGNLIVRTASGQRKRLVVADNNTFTFVNA